jgi:isocitrate lyase
MHEAEMKGVQGDELEGIEKEWLKMAKIMRFDEAVVETIKNAGLGAGKAQEYLKLAAGKSNLEARAICKKITGKDIFWDWDAPRSREGTTQSLAVTYSGFYRYEGGTEACISRAIAYAPYADLLWYLLIDMHS